MARPRPLKLTTGKLSVPAHIVTEPLGIFANRGYGKTYSVVDLVEELYASDLPSVILDIKGDWWGLRSDTTGTSDGLPFIIFGGDHADVPLEEGSGATIAAFIAERSIPAIIDLSFLSKTKARNWTRDFAVALYDAKRKHRSPLMLVVDEADILIPQRLAPELLALLGAMEDIAKRGRGRGLGVTVVAQRVQDVNKSVTDLLTTLLLGNVTGVRMRKALKEWVDDHARAEDETTVEDVIGSLSRLEPGEFWLWSPTFLKTLLWVKMRPITTFDSYKTPAPGQTMRMPKTLAEVDVGSLSAELTEAVERAKAEDPAELRKRIRALERSLDLAESKVSYQEMPVEVRVEVPVEVPVFTDEELALLRQISGQWDAAYDQAVKVVTDTIGPALERAAHPPHVIQAPPPARPARREPTPRVERAAPRPSGDPAPAVASGHIPPAQRDVLNAIAWFETIGIANPTRVQLAWSIGQSAGGGGFSNKLSAMKTAGLIEYGGDGTVLLTQAGSLEAETPPKALTTHALQEAVLGKLPPAKRKVMELLISIYPLEMTRKDLAEHLGESSGGGGFTNKISALKTPGFLVYSSPGCVRAADLLFIN